MNHLRYRKWRFEAFLFLILARRWLSFIRRIWSFESMNLLPTSMNLIVGRPGAVPLVLAIPVPSSYWRPGATPSTLVDSSDRPCRLASSRALLKAVGRTGS